MCICLCSFLNRTERRLKMSGLWGIERLVRPRGFEPLASCSGTRFSLSRDFLAARPQTRVSCGQFWRERWIRTLVADKRLSSRNRFSGASSFNPEGFFHEAITNTEDLPVKTNRRIGVVNPELNLVTHLKRAIGIVELNDAMLGV